MNSDTESLHRSTQAIEAAYRDSEYFDGGDMAPHDILKLLCHYLEMEFAAKARSSACSARKD